MKYPKYRSRRLRQNKNFRRMIRDTRLSVDDLVMPFFVRSGKNIKKAISSMPGIFQLSIDNLIKEAKELMGLGVPAIILFGIPDKKDESAGQAYARDGIIQKALEALKDKLPEMLLITDVCLCEYMSHGHCGIIKRRKTQSSKHGFVDNDATLELLSKTALSHAEAGADIVAPSAMMDGQVKCIREVLDQNNYSDTPIMAYSAKYASSFYGPFRDAVESPPRFGDRSSYQMDSANSDEAMREIMLDINEGADIIMVKPALSYLDIIRRAKEKFNLPVAAYSVSGEYSMIKAAQKNGWIDGDKAMLEILVSIKRAGADIIVTYFAKQAAKKL